MCVCRLLDVFCVCVCVCVISFIPTELVIYSSEKLQSGCFLSDTLLKHFRQFCSLKFDIQTYHSLVSDLNVEFATGYNALSTSWSCKTRGQCCLHVPQNCVHVVRCLKGFLPHLEYKNIVIKLQ